jgi:hypothetical protein
MEGNQVDWNARDKMKQLRKAIKSLDDDKQYSEKSYWEKLFDSLRS